MKFEEKIRKVQKYLTDHSLDGWLLYDFRHSNDLACQFLEIEPDKMLTRRFFYWIPREGYPIKIVSKVEEHVLDHLPGDLAPYRSWQELEKRLSTILQEAAEILMEYSPRNAIPYVSKVDAGTIELIREFGITVLSSADLLQQFTSVWDEEKYQSHLFAAKVLDETASGTWQWIASCLREKKQITEYDVQQYIVEAYTKKGCLAADLPICAVNANAANPHYTPTKESCSSIKPGDFILIDLWCKQNLPQAVYADITRIAVARHSPTHKEQKVFNVVREAQKVATDLVRERFAAQEPLMGWEVDEACRRVIVDAGFGEYFVHRTGHNIDVQDHGYGANIDNLETHDQRYLLTRTCFSIEPGIYLPGEFGVRLEYDVYIHSNGEIQVTGGIQEEIICLNI